MYLSKASGPPILQTVGRPRPTLLRVWVWAWTCTALWAVLPAPAGAACLPNPNADLHRLQTRLQADATDVLREVHAKLDAVSREPATASATAYLAGLYAVEAESYQILELLPQARAAAAEGLKLATNVHDPVHLDLLSAFVQSAFDAATITQGIDALAAARAVQTPDSLADTCLIIARGLLENLQDRADLAIVTLTQAYHASVAPEMAEAHILSASMLSMVMSSMGDYAQALTLNQQEIDWDVLHRAKLSLSVSRFMRGQILKLMGSYPAAIVEFSDARKLSVLLADEQGVAYADLRICESHIELDEVAAARQECAAAMAVFVASHAADSVKETQALFARIELQQGRAVSALAILNDVLDQSGADLLPLHLAPLYQTRALANAHLQRFRSAYDDLNEYVKRHASVDAAQRLRQAGALRARFETDREIERNALLKRELAVAQERTDRQAQQIRDNAIVVVAGVCVIALLLYFLVANFRYRQQLQKLASIDGLTGLPNRRRVAQLATAAMETARATHQPLAIAVLDMDHFKAINDCCGHATGDHVLKEFARAGTAALRQSDVLGRWGGEEFLLMMPGATLEVAVANLQRLRTLVSGIKLPASGMSLRVSLSAGVAPLDWSVKSLDELIARADAALYAAKNDGRDVVRIADANYVTGSHAIRRAQRL